MSLLNCLCAAIPVRERVVTCEEVFELLDPPPVVGGVLARVKSAQIG
jgi:pilus assembly protein CpaF